MIKLVLSDIDNTLVPLGEPHVSPRTIDAIHELVASGVRFGPATGREHVELLRFFDSDESCFQTGIISNGKRVRVDGSYVCTHLIPHEALVAIDEAIRPEEGMFLVCYPAQSDVSNPAYAVGATRREVAIFEERSGFEGHLVDEVPHMDLIAATIACPGGRGRELRCREVVASRVPEVDITLPVPEWFDILPKGVSKAAGLDVLLDELGLGLDEVVVFGDAENDLAILGRVPYSVAVANATDAVREVARHYVGACADEGVADALLELARATRAQELPAFLREDQP